MEIWIKKDAKNVIRLPINPPGFEVTREGNNTEITRYGKISAVVMGNATLRRVAFSSFFPKQKYIFNQYKKSYKLSNGAAVSLKSPIEYVKLINSWINQPVTLIITGGYVNNTYTIESFSYHEPDKAGDIAYSIEFKKYVKPTYTKPKKTTSSANKTNDKSSSPGNKSDRPTKPVTTKKYTVKKGDTLQSIAKKQTGNSANWRKIYNDNKSVIEKEAKKRGKGTSKNGHWIFPGTKLVIKK